jgi:hypothetical protein
MMAKVKNEPTLEDKMLKAAAMVKDKNEKLSWSRTKKNMEDIINGELNPLSEEILEIERQHWERLQPLIDRRQILADKVDEVRMKMLKTCIHPLDHLQFKGTYIECKFCSAKLSLPRNVQ